MTTSRPTLDTITLTMPIGYATMIDQALAAVADAKDVDDIMLRPAADALELIGDARATIRGCRLYSDGTAKVAVTTPMSAMPASTESSISGNGCHGGLGRSSARWIIRSMRLW